MNDDSMREMVAKARRELMRWQVLVSLHIAAPYGYNAVGLKPIIAASYPDVTDAEIKKHLDYLRERELIHLNTDPLGMEFAKLARDGFDVVEYTVACDPGISRPRKTGGA
jgi:hypothetical protein